MQSTDLKYLDSSPVDDATKAAIEEGLAAAERGETVTLDQAKANFRKRLQAWREAKEEVKAAA